MAGKKKHVDEVVDNEVRETVPETPVAIDAAHVHTEECDHDMVDHDENGHLEEQALAMHLSDVPLADLKEAIGLIRESCARSNNQEFRLRCKRLEAALGEFVGAIDSALNG